MHSCRQPAPSTVHYESDYACGKWYEPRSVSCLSGVIVRVRVVFRKTEHVSAVPER